MKKFDWKPVLFVLLLAAAMPLFAEDLLPPKLQGLADSVLGIFTGGFVRTILIICLAGCAVAYGFNKDNEKMKRNIIAIGIAVAIVIGAQFIVEKVWQASGGSL